jgi:hypothetical protein
MQVTPSVVVASILPPMAGTVMTTCSNVDARHCAQRVLQHVESLKDANADQEGITNPLSLLQDIYSFTDLLILVLVALAAHLEATEKALSEGRAARLATDQSLAEEKVVWQIADQALRSSQEANATLNWDLQSTQASVTATMEKLSSKSSALDLAMI